MEAAGLQSQFGSTKPLLIHWLFPTIPAEKSGLVFVFQPTFKRNAAAAMVVTFHGGRNEQNFSKKKTGLVLTALPHLCHVQTWELYFAHCKNIVLKELQIL